MPIDPQHTYVHLAEDGAAHELSAATFWETADAAPAGGADKSWLVTEFAFTADWPTWEMHPQGDELVYLLAGAIDLHLEQDDGLKVIAIDGSGAVVVPRGVWHTAKVRAPSRMLHVTRGGGTLTRPV